MNKFIFLCFFISQIPAHGEWNKNQAALIGDIRSRSRNASFILIFTKNKLTLLKGDKKEASKNPKKPCLTILNSSFFGFTGCTYDIDENSDTVTWEGSKDKAEAVPLSAIKSIIKAELK